MSSRAASSEPLGTRLRKIREDRKLSLRAVERASGINSGYLSQLERNEIANPTPSVLQKVAAAYDQPVGLLMQWAGYIEDGLSTGAQRALSLGDDLTEDEVEALKAVLDVLRKKNSATFMPGRHRTDLILQHDDRAALRGAALGVLRELNALTAPEAVVLEDATVVAKLVSVGAIELDTHDRRRLRDRFGDMVDRAMAKFQGVVHLDRGEVFLNPTMHASKKRFVWGHEIGHAVLEDHRVVFAHLDDHKRLSPEFNDLLERQANQFSIELLAKGDLLTKEFDSSQPSVASIESLASRYGISLQATARRLAEESKRAVAIAVVFRGTFGAPVTVGQHKVWASEQFAARHHWDELGSPSETIEDRLLAAADGKEVEPFSVEDAEGRVVEIQVEGKETPYAVFLLMHCPVRPKLRAARCS